MKRYDLTRQIRPGGARDELMARFIDAIWRDCAPLGVSWIGFYVGPGRLSIDGQTARDDEMLLCAREPKPACSPIGLHGACGQSWSQGETLVVTHVKNLGEGYVACDPRDTSELVVPVFDESGEAWGVLDADSFDEGSFDEDDARAVADLLHASGLSSKGAAEIPVRVV